MNELLRKIANTVIANLDNTTEIGLFKGRMGLTIFLYEYARYSGNSVYEKMADTLIDRIYTQFKPGISFSMIDGSASIGIGLSYLLRNHFIEGNIDNILQDLDRKLLDSSEDVLFKETTSIIPVFSSGAYLLSRLPLCSVEQKEKWITNIIDTGISFMWKIIIRKKFEPKLSLLNSMFLVYNQLMKYNIDKENVLQLQKDLLRLSVNALEKRYYQFSDILLLKYILPLVPKEISIDGQSRLRSLLSGINMDDFNIEEWNNGLWWCFVYDITSLEYSIEAIEKYVDQKMLDYSFDLDDINSQFSVLGLNLIIKEK
ncbi:MULTISPECIES: hypothetical protein [Bacteroides]|uniref:hypothetical protein n=1 Tax=Bacteroides TaxID=816 RepID=UPI001B3C9DA6|nr:hypothetical protein [Bacteroides sp. 1001302B_160321_D4]